MACLYLYQDFIILMTTQSAFTPIAITHSHTHLYSASMCSTFSVILQLFFKMFTSINAAKTLILIMFSFTLDIYCTSVRPGRGIPHMWLSLRFLLSFYLLKGFFSSFSLLLLRVKGRGCHTLLKPYETNCDLWIWAIQIQFDWLIDW